MKGKQVFMRVSRFGWVFIVWAILPVWAQELPSTSSVASKTQSVAAGITPDRRVVIDVTVTDRYGKAVTGLRQQDFQLFDNKQERTILSVRAIPADSASDPTQIILLIDAVNGSFQSVSLERTQITKFLRENGGRLAHPVSVIVLTDLEMKQIGTPTRDGNALSALIDQNPAVLRSITRAAGFYGAVDRLRKSMQALQELVSFESPRRGKKILIWLSSGWPMLSGAAVRMGPRDQQSLFDSIVAFSASLREARLTLYSIDPLGVVNPLVAQNYYRTFLNGVTHANAAVAGNLGLQVLAVESGGLVLSGNNELAGPIATCVADADGYYLLSFDSAPADRPDEYHRIDVKVAQRGTVVRTRTAYYAQPQKALP